MHRTVCALSPTSRCADRCESPPCARAGIVVTQNRVASEVGARVLKAGGHAVDAAVAAAFAIGVVEPWMSGIGGVGAMLVYDAATGKTIGFDFGARSPKALDPDDFVLTDKRDEGNLFGWPMVAGNVNTVGAKAVVAPTSRPGWRPRTSGSAGKAWRDLVAPGRRARGGGHRRRLAHDADDRRGDGRPRPRTPARAPASCPRAIRRWRRRRSSPTRSSVCRCPTWRGPCAPSPRTAPRSLYTGALARGHRRRHPRHGRLSRRRGPGRRAAA